MSTVAVALILALALALGSAVRPAAANDSTAVLGAGGLVLVPDEEIAMESEDLFLSREEIRVAYVFRNGGPTARRVRVAFPLPDLPPDVLWITDAALPAAEDLNFVNFTVEVDGAAVTPQIERRLFIDGRDVTAEVEAAGLPFSALEPDHMERILAAAPEAKQRLSAAGIIDWSPATASMEESFLPAWTVRTTFHWEQTFPPGQPVKVRHSYQPVVGHSFFSPEDLEQTGDGAWDPRATWCIDKTTESAIRKRFRTAEQKIGAAFLNAAVVDYILVTGANWKGPIGRFTLTVDKGTPDALVSLCAPDIKKTGATTFALTRTNFVPASDLTVLFLEIPVVE